MIIDPSNKVTITVNEASYFEMTMALSYCYSLARNYEKDLEVDVLWSDYFLDDNFFYKNWDETESSLDRFNFLHSMLEFKGDVNIHFNHKILKGGLYVGEAAKKEFFKKKCVPLHRLMQGLANRDECQDNRVLLWPLRNCLERIPKKVTFWKPTFVHKMWGQADNIKWVGGPNRMKTSHMLYYYNEWNEVLDNLKKNYNVVEVEYRTPIKEVYYHLSTSEFSFGFNGICQSISVGLSTPTILCSFKPTSNLDYDHLIYSTEVSPRLFEDRVYIEKIVDIARQKVSPFRDFYEKYFGE